MTKIDKEVKQKLAEPSMFALFLLNDDVTTMDFVIGILMDIFYYELDKATQIMLEIHTCGEGRVGVFTEEIALSKQKQVANAARNAHFPLQTRIEKI